MYRKAILATGSPHILWDYCLQLMAEIRSHSVLDILDLEGDTPTTGDTSEILHLCKFAWYDHVWYIDKLDLYRMKSKPDTSDLAMRLARLCVQKYLPLKEKYSQEHLLSLSLSKIVAAVQYNNR
jgi:hypothetical protein